MLDQFTLPPADHPTRECFDETHFAEVVARGEVMTLSEALAEARALFARNSAAVGACYFAQWGVSGEPHLVLLELKKTEGGLAFPAQRVLWDFGPWSPPASPDPVEAEDPRAQAGGDWSAEAMLGAWRAPAKRSTGA